jgi:hypothetical protein
MARADGVAPAESAPEPSIGLAGAAACDVEFGDLAARFTPTDVAVPPFGLLDFPDVLAGPASPRDPCDDPAGACGREPAPLPPRRLTPPSPPPPQFLDPDPIEPCAPGAICGD